MLLRARERDDLHGDYGGAEYTQIGVEETLTGSTRERRSGTEDRAIRSARRRPVKTRLLVAGGIAVVSVILVSGQSGQAARQAAPAVPAALSPRAVVDKYCVSCHNARLKTADLEMDQLDLARLGGHAEIAERVVRQVG